MKIFVVALFCAFIFVVRGDLQSDCLASITNGNAEFGFQATISISVMGYLSVSYPNSMSQIQSIMTNIQTNVTALVFSMSDTSGNGPSNAMQYLTNLQFHITQLVGVTNSCNSTVSNQLQNQAAGLISFLMSFSSLFQGLVVPNGQAPRQTQIIMLNHKQIKKCLCELAAFPLHVLYTLLLSANPNWYTTGIPPSGQTYINGLFGNNILGQITQGYTPASTPSSNNVNDLQAQLVISMTSMLTTMIVNYPKGDIFQCNAQFNFTITIITTLSISYFSPYSALYIALNAIYTNEVVPNYYTLAAQAGLQLLAAINASLMTGPSCVNNFNSVVQNALQSVSNNYKQCLMNGNNDIAGSYALISQLLKDNVANIDNIFGNNGYCSLYHANCWKDHATDHTDCLNNGIMKEIAELNNLGVYIQNVRTCLSFVRQVFNTYLQYILPPGQPNPIICNQQPNMQSNIIGNDQ